METTTATAYDYEAQEWRDGPEGARLLLRQVLDELEQLSGPQGVRYALFIGVRPDRMAQYVEGLEAQRDALRAGLAS